PDPLPRLWIDPIRWPPSLIAMHRRTHPLLDQAFAQAPHLPRAHPKQFGRVAHAQRPGAEPRQNVDSSLLCSSQAQCPHTLKYADIFPEQLNRTLSLSSDIGSYSDLTGAADRIRYAAPTARPD